MGQELGAHHYICLEKGILSDDLTPDPSRAVSGPEYKYIPVNHSGWGGRKVLITGADLHRLCVLVYGQYLQCHSTLINVSE